MIDGNSVTVSPERWRERSWSALGLDPANPPKSLELTMGAEGQPTMDKAAAPAPVGQGGLGWDAQARIDSLRSAAAKPDEIAVREAVKARIKLESVWSSTRSSSTRRCPTISQAAVVKQLEGVDISTKSSAYTRRDTTAPSKPARP